MALAYRTADLGRSTNPDRSLVQALQHDLRQLGYLPRGIDGVFSDGTRSAVRALQYDLLHNAGHSTAGDGDAPVAITSYNRGVGSVTGVVDPPLADSIEALLADERVIKLPNHDDPAAANHVVMAAIAALRSTEAPIPFLLAIIAQETGGRHYAVPPSTSDSDNYLTIGLDRNGATDAVTSRGYGVAQYTLFHHPPRADEAAQVIADPAQNVAQATANLADKFGHFVLGTGGADDRAVEHRLLPLRICRYAPTDPRYMTDCRTCAQQTGKIDIAPTTPLYAGAGQTYGEGHAYAETHYQGVPDRAGFLCDWPYAIRRYNGAGPNSFNYQARILLNLLAGPQSSLEA